MSQSQESQSSGSSNLGNGIVIGVFFVFIFYLLPANLFWYVLTLLGVTEPYYNGILEALTCPWNLDRAFHPLSWGPFLFDCVFSGIAWVSILKVCGVKL